MGKVNATLPKDTEPADVTMEMAVALIAENVPRRSGPTTRVLANRAAPSAENRPDAPPSRDFSATLHLRAGFPPYERGPDSG
jgi:topoisomerase IA-like protein